MQIFNTAPVGLVVRDFSKDGGPDNRKLISGPCFHRHVMLPSISKYINYLISYCRVFSLNVYDIWRVVCDELDIRGERNGRTVSFFNINMPSYQYMYSHYTDKTASRPSNLNNGPRRNILTLKTDHGAIACQYKMNYRSACPVFGHSMLSLIFD